MISNARAYFDNIMAQQDKFAFLSGLVTSPPSVSESEWLDFKQMGPPKDVLKTWSEAVTGFANTEGGVIIWGIDCRKKIDNVDAASDVVLIEKPLELKSVLYTNIHQTSDPPVQGIQIETVAGSDGKGFVVCFIPEGPNKPYRSEQTSQKWYFIRVGDSFRNPNPSLLRRMFFPRASPNLRIVVRPKVEKETHDDTTKPPVVNVSFAVLLENLGKASADQLYVVCRLRGGFRHTWYDLLRNYSHPNQQQGAGMEFQSPLHPTMVSEFASVSVKVPASIVYPDNLKIPGHEVKLEFEVFGRDIEPKKFEVTFADWEAPYEQPPKEAMAVAAFETDAERRERLRFQ